jgi:hypothetical protein
MARGEVEVSFGSGGDSVTGSDVGDRAPNEPSGSGSGATKNIIFSPPRLSVIKHAMWQRRCLHGLCESYSLDRQCGIRHHHFDSELDMVAESVGQRGMLHEK